MNTGENIRNALHVLYKTYENIDKLLNDCQAAATDCGYYQPCPKFLNWSISKKIPLSWLINDFIVLFQHNNTPDGFNENGWKKAPVYVLEICLGLEDDISQLPTLYLSQFCYSDSIDWKTLCRDFANFYDPIHADDNDFQRTNDIPRTTYLTTTEAKKIYNGLDHVVTIEIPLLELNADNMREKIFGSFELLRTRQNIKAHTDSTANQDYRAYFPVV